MVLFVSPKAETYQPLVTMVLLRSAPSTVTNDRGSRVSLYVALATRHVPPGAVKK